MSKIAQIYKWFTALGLKNKIVSFAIVFGLFGTVVFQNCARGKYNLSPEQITQLAQAFCQGGVTETCSNETGSGLRCSVPLQDVAAGVCVFQSCNEGYVLEGNLCVPRECTPGTVAACTYMLDGRSGLAKTSVPAVYGIKFETAAGQMVCGAAGTYGPCTPTICSDTEILIGKLSAKKALISNIEEVPPSSTPTSSPSATPTFSPSPTPTFSPTWTPTGSPTATFTPSPTGDEPTEKCVLSCEDGERLCNAIGSGFINRVTCETIGGVSVFRGCSPDGCVEGAVRVDNEYGGYTCMMQICDPNSTLGCTTNYGSGTQTCDTNGLSWGSCQLTECNDGYVLNNGVCEFVDPNVICEPGTSATCFDSVGVGTHVCEANGYGYGACTYNSCYAGYTLSGTECLPTPPLVCVPPMVNLGGVCMMLPGAPCAGFPGCPGFGFKVQK